MTGRCVPRQAAGDVRTLCFASATAQLCLCAVLSAVYTSPLGYWVLTIALPVQRGKDGKVIAAVQYRLETAVVWLARCGRMSYIVLCAPYSFAAAALGTVFWMFADLLGVLPWSVGWHTLLDNITVVYVLLPRQLVVPATEVWLVIRLLHS